MKDRVYFDAYRDGRRVYSSWAVRGTVSEALEREVYQTRLDRGDFSHVEVHEPATATIKTLLREHTAESDALNDNDQ